MFNTVILLVLTRFYDRATLSAIVYFEWSPPTALANPFKKWSARNTWKVLSPLTATPPPSPPPRSLGGVAVSEDTQIKVVIFIKTKNSSYGFYWRFLVYCTCITAWANSSPLVSCASYIFLDYDGSYIYVS